jgi:hypothetical protein
MAKTYLGRNVTKELFSLGIGGQIERSEEDPPIPPEASVTFTATAKFGATKHKFLDDGTVHEFSILTIDASSFRIDSVEEKPEDPQLPLGDEESGEAEAGLN